MAKLVIIKRTVSVMGCTNNALRFDVSRRLIVDFP